MVELSNKRSSFLAFMMSIKFIKIPNQIEAVILRKLDRIFGLVEIQVIEINYNFRRKTIYH